MCQGALEQRIDALEEKYGREIAELKTQNAALLERMHGLESAEQKRIEALEAIHGKVTNALKAENAALRERVDGLESGERKRVEALEAIHGSLIGALGADSTEEPEAVGRHESEEAISLPPEGPGMLMFLKQNKYTVRVAVSSQGGGSTDCLLTEDASFWHSDNRPRSWIRWTLPDGVKAVVTSVKMIGRIGCSGVKHFVIEGSNDGWRWTCIINSQRGPMTFEDWVTRGEALDGQRRAFSMIRLTQTGPRYAPPFENWHHLTLTYADFSGTIFFPERAV
jgi:hypothetical protein